MSKSVRALRREISPEEVLRAAGIAAGPLEARHGWSNRAWVGDLHVVRISSGRLDGSLAHEHRMVNLVWGYGIPVAEVIAHGRVEQLPGRGGESGEWIVSRRLPGDTLAVAWPHLDRAARRHLGRALGDLMRSLHDIPAGPTAPPWWTAAHRPPLLRNAYRPRVALGPDLVAAAGEVPGADHRLLQETEALLVERAELFANDPEVLVHGDIHGHNLLVTPPPDCAISGLLDWEGARRGPADLELDMLVRWVIAADDFPQSPGAPSHIQPGDCLELLDHVAAAYPEMFAVPNLRERLEVYEALWHLVQLLFDSYWRANHPAPRDAPSPTWRWLQALLDGKSPLADLRLML